MTTIKRGKDQGLSKLQRFIISEAYLNGIVKNADILIKWYKFKPAYAYRAIKFSRAQIGVKKYSAASVAVSRSLTRLRGRGLMIRSSMCGHRLSAKGVQAVKRYQGNG